MGNKIMRFFMIILTVLFLTSCAETAGESADSELSIAAAVSLTESLNELKGIYEQEHDIKLNFQFGSSGTLARQIEQGSGADVFISSNVNWMEALEKKQQILSGTRQDIVGNQLVLVASEDTELTYEDVIEIDPEKIGQIAIGNPESVPAGEYAKQTLTELGLWNELENQLVLAKDVRQVVTYVKSGNVDAGFIYKSDVVVAEGLEVLATVETDLHDAIIYPGAVIAGTKNKESSEEFLRFLLTEEAQEVFKSFGFEGAK